MECLGIIVPVVKLSVAQVKYFMFFTKEFLFSQYNPILIFLSQLHFSLSFSFYVLAIHY